MKKWKGLRHLGWLWSFVLLGALTFWGTTHLHKSPPGVSTRYGVNPLPDWTWHTHKFEYRSDSLRIHHRSVALGFVNLSMERREEKSLP
jgi:hypothetical protein